MSTFAMARDRRLLAIAFVAGLAGGSVAAARDGKQDFAKGLEQCQRLLGKGQWREAKNSLGALLQAHADQDYVRVRKEEIIENFRRCAFYLQYRPPAPASLIKGKLLSWSATTGEISVSYTEQTLTDFQVIGRTSSDSPIRVHPVKFRGPYSIEIKGPSYAPGRAALPVVIACVESDQMHHVVLGLKPVDEGSVVRSAPAEIERYENGTSSSLDTKSPSPAKQGVPFSVKVAVTKGEIAGYYNGEKVVAARKAASLFGSVGFLSFPHFTEIVVKGEAEPAWIQGLLDAAANKAREEFEKTYNPTGDLPDWLKGDRPVTSNDAPKELGLPGVLTAEQGSRVHSVLELLANEKSDQALMLVTGWKDQDAPEETRAYLLARLYEASHQPEKALPLCDRVRQIVPDFVDARRLRGSLLDAMHRRGEAIAEYRRLLDESRAEAEDVEALAVLLLREGRPEEAMAVIERGATASIRTKDLDVISALLVKALKGPNWSKSFEYESRNFVVRSDIDRDTCIEASRILEESYLAYTFRLRKIADLEKRKFRVYLFSGEAGYAAYIREVGHGNPRHTAGLYSPTLKQLLIWNVRDRDAMMRVVRHEGFHQYLDRLMDDPPRWFNEGLAEYYERAAMVGGTWVQGKPHPEDLWVLRSRGSDTKLIDLRAFLYMNPEAFYQGDVALHYAQGWALVHFLRHSTKENDQLFEKLFDALASNVGNREALDRTLQGVDFAKLQLDLAKHIASLPER